MTSWHLASCRRPHIYFLEIDGSDVPSCVSCGTHGILDDGAHIHADKTVPETPLSAGFDMSWPSSLPFLQDTTTTHTSKEVYARVKRTTTNMAPKNLVFSTSSSTTTAATYQSLDSRKIRLIHLLPGKYGDPICCTLKIADLATMPEYEALSYTWADDNGDTTKSERIYIGECHDVLPITVNCANALRRLRFPHQDRILWIDAICINQNDTNERSHQVGLMQYIYATALRVIIYLGEDPEEHKSRVSKPWMFENQGNTLDLSQDLSTRPYFTRAWVVQEIASAKVAWVLHGSRGARWQDFVESEKSFDRRYNSEIVFRNALRLDQYHPWLRHVIQPKHRDLDELYELLLATEACHASDPRDKVFALLGLFHGATDAGLVADYSLSRGQVFGGLTAFILHQHHELWPQIFAMVDPAEAIGMPSWAVDWSVSRRSSTDHSPSMVSSETPLAISTVGNRHHLSRHYLKVCPLGGLVVKALLVCGLSKCSVDPRVENGPPGVVTGIRHAPEFPAHQLQKLIEATSWARTVDEVFIVSGLTDHMLVLRPSETANTYSFVAICDQPRFDLHTDIIECMSKEVLLLIGAWNRVLGQLSSDAQQWFTEDKWKSIEAACNRIRKRWVLEVEPNSSLPRKLCRLLTQLFRGFNWGRSGNLSTKTSLPELQATGISRLPDFVNLFDSRPFLNTSYLSDKPGHTTNRIPDPHAFVLQTCWSWGVAQHRADTLSSPPPAKHPLRWYSHYFDVGEVDKFKKSLEHVIRTGTEDFEGISPATVVEVFLQQNLGVNVSVIDKILRDMEPNAMRKFLTDSLELYPSGHRKRGREHNSPSWAHDFERMCSILEDSEMMWCMFVDSGTKRPGHMDAERMWALLLDLVRETEKHLLPLKMVFCGTLRRSQRSAVSGRDKVWPDIRMWPDIRIV